MGPLGIGIPGLILILIVALLLFGPSKLPELGRAFGRTLKEFKRGANDIMSEEEESRKEINRSESTKDTRDSDRHEDNRRLPD